MADLNSLMSMYKFLADQPKTALEMKKLQADAGNPEYGLSTQQGDDIESIKKLGGEIQKIKNAVKIKKENEENFPPNGLLQAVLGKQNWRGIAADTGPISSSLLRVTQKANPETEETQGQGFIAGVMNRLYPEEMQARGKLESATRPLLKTQMTSGSSVEGGAGSALTGPEKGVVLPSLPGMELQDNIFEGNAEEAKGQRLQQLGQTIKRLIGAKQGNPSFEAYVRSIAGGQ